MKPTLALSVVFVVALFDAACGQLPPRPALGEIEEPLTAEFALKLDDVFEQYSENLRRINRFVGVATLERTWKRNGEPLHTDLMWFIHAQDFEQHVRRIDELTSALGPVRNGTQRIGVAIRSTIETNEGVMQFQTHNAISKVSRASFDNEEQFSRKFRVQTRLNFWELPFRGSFDVRLEGTSPGLAWRELPKTPAAFQEGGQVTAWHEDSQHTLARVTLDKGFAYDFTFSKKLGNMPTRVVLSRNDKHVRAVTAIVDTEWLMHRNDEFPQSVYLPAQIRCQFETPGSGNGNDTHELQLDWIIGESVSEYIFSQDSELFMDSVEIKELVRVQAIDGD